MLAVKRPLAVLFLVVGLTVAAFAYTTSASAYPGGTGASLTGSASVVAQGGGITVSGTHFKGLVTLSAVGTSGRVTLGTVTAGSDGTFSLRLSMPAGEFPPGTYTIRATDNFGDVESITVTVSTAGGPVTPVHHGGGGLATTGVAVGSIGGIGVLLLLGGGLMLLAGRRRHATA